MHENAIKSAGRLNFWKKSNYKKPETRPEPEEIFQNPTRPEPEKNFKTRTRPEPDIWQPDPSLVQMHPLHSHKFGALTYKIQGCHFEKLAAYLFTSYTVLY